MSPLPVCGIATPYISTTSALDTTAIILLALLLAVFELGNPLVLSPPHSHLTELTVSCIVKDGVVVPESLPRYLAGDIYGFNEIVHKFPNLFCHFLHFQYTYCGFHNQLVLPIFSERSGGQPAFKYQQCSIKAV
jgi:hypothetical protein